MCTALDDPRKKWTYFLSTSETRHSLSGGGILQLTLPTVWHAMTFVTLTWMMLRRDNPSGPRDHRTKGSGSRRTRLGELTWVFLLLPVQ